MTVKKCIISAAVLASATALFAQQIHIGGYTDFTSTAATQVFHQYPNEDDWEHTDVAAEFGPVQNGIHFLNLDATAPNVDFHTSVWIGSGMGGWYADVPEFVDRTNSTAFTGTEYFSQSGDDTSTPIMQMWACTHFVNDQLRFYTGDFASNGWNAGYVYGGYVLGGQKITGLAGRAYGDDSAFSGVEIQPAKLTGFKMIAGFPVAPFTDSYKDFNDWQHLAKAVKVMAQYRWLLYNVTFNGGFRPNYYMTNGDGYTFSGGDFKKSLFSEAFLQVDLPSLFYGIRMNASYDLRWRKAEVDGSLTLDGEDWSKTAFAHIGQFSLQYTAIPGWTFGFEDRFAYYAPHYYAINETAVYNIFAVNGSHPIPGTSYAFGFETQFMYGQDANGTANGLRKPDYCDAYCSDLISFDANFMGLDGDDKHAPAKGHAGRYFSVYGYPYFQKNFANGYARLGLEVQYKRLETSNVLKEIAWRIPVGLVFWW